MTLHRRRFLVAAAFLATGAPLTAADTQPAVRIAMPSCLFRDLKPEVISALARPFNAIVQEQTGFTNELVVSPSADDMRLQLESGKVQFAVFHSYEFAWMAAKQPALQPLMIAAPRRRPIQTYVVVHASNPAESVADLRGKVVAIPTGTREYYRLYIDRQCRANGKPASEFFGGVTTPPEQESALHEVVDNKRTHAALVDIGGLEHFARRHPVRNKRIRVLAKSEEFPPSVIVYRKGAVDEATLRRFRNGMANANSTTFGKHLLAMWNLSGFEPIPADYADRVAAIAKLYPPLPEETK